MNRKISKKLNVLLLCDLPEYASNANTLVDHINAFKMFSDQEVTLLSNRGDLPALLRLSSFDVIVIHYSIFVLRDYFLSKRAKRRISKFKGLKIQFIQDEYRFVDQMTASLRDMKIDILFSCISSPEREVLYPPSKLPNLTLKTVLTGYVPNNLLHIKNVPIHERGVTVSYRGRKLPYWYGSTAQEKWTIAQNFLTHIKIHRIENWNCDIEYKEENRVYGDNWISFLLNSKATLGVESSASLVDFDGSLHARVEEYQEKNPEATFQEVENLIFPSQDKKTILKCISPRCFEAICTRTALVLFEGDYSDVLVPWKHYLPLKKDFSNFMEISEKINDVSFLEEMTAKAYEDIVLSEKYTYKAMIKEFDKSIKEHWKFNKLRRSVFPVSKTELRVILPISLAIKIIFFFPEFVERISKAIKKHGYKGFYGLLIRRVKYYLRILR